MKLFTRRGAALSVHILLREIGRPFELKLIGQADRNGGRQQPGLPILVLVNGEQLTEPMVIAQFACDAAFRIDLMPGPRTLARYRVMEWQGVAAELKTLLWRTDMATPASVIARIVDRLHHIEARMDGPYLTGETFTAADAACFDAASRLPDVGIDLAAFPRIKAYLKRIAQRPSVVSAIRFEQSAALAATEAPHNYRQLGPKICAASL